jgi:hypothetical protein
MQFSLTTLAFFGATPKAWAQAADAGTDAASEAAGDAAPDAGSNAGDAAPPDAPVPSQAAAVVPGALAEPEETGKKKGKKKHKEGAEGTASDTPKKPSTGEFEAKGRVFVVADYDRRSAIFVDPTGTPGYAKRDSLDLDVRSARVGLRYRANDEWLTALLELELTRKPDMRDGWVQARGKYVAARAGQFRMPVSGIEMESPWTLPTVRRGVLHDILTDRLDVAGRRPGFMLTYRGRGQFHPRLMLGAFQGSYLVTESPDERKTHFLWRSSLSAQSLAARAEVELLGATLGAYYEDRVGAPSTVTMRHFWTAGADLAFDRTFESGGVRFWLESIAGASWYEHRDKPADGKDATFLAGRGILAYRFGGTTYEEFYVEPYALVAALDPDLDVTDDLLYEGMLGINVGIWERARLSLQGEFEKSRRNFPTGYFVGPGPDRMGVTLQAGVNF